MKDFNLNEEKITTGFKVPEGYFDQFENKLLKQLEIENKPKVITFWQSKRIWMTSIAAFFLVSIALPVYYSMNSTTINQVDDEAIESYIVMQPSMTIYDIATHLTSEEITTIEESLTLNDDAVELYLEENYQNVDLYLSE